MSIYQKYFDELNAKSAESAVATANWLIKIAAAASSSQSGGTSGGSGSAITFSKIPNFTDYSYLHEFEYYIDRRIEKPMAESVKPDGGLRADDLKIVLSTSFLTPDFNNHLHKNNCLDITIVRMQTLQNDSPVAVETLTFQTCYTTQYFQRGDIIAASFRYASYSKSYQSSNTEGGSEGSVASSYSFVNSSSQS